MSEGIAHLKNEAVDVFRSQFSTNPTHIASAPGRVNLIGEHLDYNDGWVLPAAINRYTMIAAKPIKSSRGSNAVIFSSALNQTVEISLDKHEPTSSGGWSRYVAGVISCFATQNIDLPPFQAVIHSSIPIGAGLASSAALEVATATLLESLSGTEWTPLEKARLCQSAEQNFAGVPCGIMDQYTCIFGKKNKLLHLDCMQQESQRIPFPSDALAIVIIDSKTKHELNSGEYETRRSECRNALKNLGFRSWREVSLRDLDDPSNKMTKVEKRRARHIVTEIVRTNTLSDALAQRQWKVIPDLLFNSHRSLRDDFQVSCKELDLLVDLSRQIPSAAKVLGSRMTGGGFGGCTISLVSRGSEDAVIEEITSAYRRQLGITAEAFTTLPTDGARLLNPLN